MKKMILRIPTVAFFIAFAAPSIFANDDHNPIGVSGAFEGMITTGCAYNVLNHNARREIDDIVVPGAVGKYGLKMTRYYNSRDTHYLGFMGPGWSYEYLWLWGNDKVTHPNGDVWDSHCTGEWSLPGPLGVSEAPGPLLNGHRTFRLADGGTVVFENPSWGVATKIIDPYGLETTITLDNASGRITQVREPGGRYLQFNYSQVGDPPRGLPNRLMLTGVDAYDGQGNRVDYVIYNYTSKPTGGSTVQWAMCLTSVNYSDGQRAKYTWQADNQPENPSQPCPCPLRLLPLVIGCDDVRYRGPMRRIAYQYPNQGAHGAITLERYWDGVPGNESNGVMVSKILPAAPSPTDTSPTFDTLYTEYRGDGPTRTFTYTPLRLGRPTQEGEICPTWHVDPTTNPAPQQFLQSYTDFQGKTTRLDYDPITWYITSVQDANGHTTSYTRGPPPPAGIGQITQIEHPDRSTINYDYTGANGGPWYVMTITDERGNQTVHTRDSNHRITSTTHKDSQPQHNIVAYEEFQYLNNPFGLLSTHHLPGNATANGAYVHFQYDGRGLLIAKTNPTTRSNWNDAIANAPKTTYTYYTADDGKPGWIDRVKTMTLPANAQGLRASETYEYDLGPGNYSRGLVTKIQHADLKYQSFGYDIYGNKLWEENERRNHTAYEYDEYNRVTKITDPLLKSETFSYLKPGASSSYLHTTNSVYTHTSRAQIVTTNVYDGNFREKSTTVGSSTTSFDYDNVGNLTDVTDPNNHKTHNTYDNRNRKASAAEAWGTALQATTVWHYDGASNINRIDRPDGQHEWRGYDALNRMNWQNVKRQIAGTNPVESEDLVTGFGYWPSGKLAWVQDPNHYGPGGLATYFVYNASDELITMYYPNQSLSIFQSWTYDDAHNLASRTTVNNETQSFTYDIRNRKTGMSWSNGADWASFTYYDDSRLKTAQNANSLITRDYDAAGRLMSDQQEVNGLGIKNVTYPWYDDDGKLKRIFLTGGGYDYTFDYDGMGRFWTIKPTNGSLAFKYEYDLASNVTHRYAYPGANVTVDQRTPRDSLNRISSRWIYKGATPLAAQGYTYDPMNRLTQVNWGSVYDWFGYYWDSELAACAYGVPQDGNGPGQLQAGQNPDLDSDGSTDPWAGYQAPDVVEPEPTAPTPDPPPRPRPTPHPRPTPPPPPTPTPPPFPDTLYVYDRSGNRTWVADVVNGGKDYAPNDLNQYTSITDSTISNGNEHEVSGYKGPTDLATVTYSYINDERLKQASDGTNAYTLAYDALGRCVKRSLNGATTYYIYDGEKPILEYGPNNALAKNVYGKGIDEILMRTDSTVNNGQAFYYGQNHEGSVTHLINASGNVIESYRYDVFGAVAFYDGNGIRRLPNATAYNNRFLFTGREYAATYQTTYVPAFIFYEYRARAYHPGLGRFMSEDHKLADTGDYNLFRYCYNDPIDHTDPMGTEPPVASSPREMSLKLAEQVMATRELLGLSTTFMRAAQSAMEGLTMAYTNQSQQGMFTYSLKPQYKIGDLSGARGYQYVWDSDQNCSGQCMTTVQHLSGAPSSKTPLLRGDPVGPKTKQGAAIATGFEFRKEIGQWVYPSKPANQSNNHAAFYIGQIGRGLMQTLEAQRGIAIHLDRQSMAGWYEINSRRPPSAASTSELHAAGGLYGPFY